MNFIFDPSLVLYLPLYKMDGASFVSKDAHGHLCSVTGALWRPNGRYFDGVDDYITLTKNAEPIGAKTVFFWIKTDTEQSGKHIYSTSQGAANIGQYLRIQTTGVDWRVSTGGGYCFPTLSTTGTIGDDVWHCLAFTWDGTTNTNGAKAYFDGNLEAQTTATSTQSGTPTYNVVIGRLPSLISGYEMAGLIGELLAYNRSLSPLEVQRNYLATKGRYR